VFLICFLCSGATQQWADGDETRAANDAPQTQSNEEPLSMSAYMLPMTGLPLFVSICIYLFIIIIIIIFFLYLLACFRFEAWQRLTSGAGKNCQHRAASSN
jgi:hypothetical protein